LHHYSELLQYVKEHGNAAVPHIYPENKALGLWVHKQRRNYKVYKQQLQGDALSHIENTETSLSPERAQKLNDAGFIWDVHEANWLERFEELKKYRKDHGDTLVPLDYPVYPGLGKWVERQRADYKKYTAKTKQEAGGTPNHNVDKRELETTRHYSGLNEERIRLLESQDFIFDPLEYVWQLRYNELCEWIALNGHGAIRKGKKHYSPLEGWAENQRRLYKKYLNGEQTSLTEERIEKLIRAGFIFLNETRATRAKSTKRKQSINI
jgi:hypothetical protein